MFPLVFPDAISFRAVVRSGRVAPSISPSRFPYSLVCSCSLCHSSYVSSRLISGPVVWAPRPASGPRCVWFTSSTPAVVALTVGGLSVPGPWDVVVSAGRARVLGPRLSCFVSALFGSFPVAFLASLAPPVAAPDVWVETVLFVVCPLALWSLRLCVFLPSV